MASVGKSSMLPAKTTESLQSGRLDEIIAALEEVARLDPLDPAIHYELGLCYGGACGRHSLYNPEIALKHLRTALRQNDAASEPIFEARILGALGNAYVGASQSHRIPRLLAAIECHRKAAEIYLQRQVMEDWVRELYNEANDWCELPEEQYPEKWNEATTLYEIALQVRSKRSDPEHYAATVQNLGTAYRELPSGDRPQNARKSIACYHEALRIHTSAAAPLKYAALQNNLGNAYLTLAGMEKTSSSRHARRSLRHFERALQFFIPENSPCDYAATQFNRGQAYLFITSKDLEEVGRAAHCFTEAAEHFALCGQQERCAVAKARLGQVRPLLATLRETRATA